ncbi:MAG: hypothetical protein A2W19_04715 [Spirochaetes bacterium RBG_16_49_21]|nr:MAG: hypothetical protein A2W19_04715 [Spirochaetes bacterium RBG_16_49_21]
MMPGRTMRILFLLVLISFAVADAPAGSQTGDSPIYDECASLCSSLTGKERVECIRMCVNSKRRSSPRVESDVKKRMSECEDICSAYTGVEKIKCIRICLDRNKPARPGREEIIKDTEDPCESRCGVLSGSLKDKCMLKCRREHKFEYQDQSKSKKK